MWQQYCIFVSTLRGHSVVRNYICLRPSRACVGLRKGNCLSLCWFGLYRVVLCYVGLCCVALLCCVMLCWLPFLVTQVMLASRVGFRRTSKAGLFLRRAGQIAVYCSCPSLFYCLLIFFVRCPCQIAFSVYCQRKEGMSLLLHSKKPKRKNIVFPERWLLSADQGFFFKN